MNGIRSCAILLAGLLAACGGSSAATVGDMTGGESDAGVDASSSGDSTTSSGDSTANTIRGRRRHGIGHRHDATRKRMHRRHRMPDLELYGRCLRCGMHLRRSSMHGRCELLRRQVHERYVRPTQCHLQDRWQRLRWQRRMLFEAVPERRVCPRSVLLHSERRHLRAPCRLLRRNLQRRRGRNTRNLQRTGRWSYLSAAAGSTVRCAADATIAVAASVRLMVATGVKVCQRANGCHIDGDLCRKDSDCCGGKGSMAPGDGNVNLRDLPQGLPWDFVETRPAVTPRATSAITRTTPARSPARATTAAEPRGTRTPASSTPSVSPRCHALDKCVEAGGVCAFTGDCCNASPCVPDADRAVTVPHGDAGRRTRLRCTRCFMHGDRRLLPRVRMLDGGRSPKGTCGVPPPPNYPPDAGTPPPYDGGPLGCAEYGQSCTTQRRLLQLGRVHQRHLLHRR